MRANIAALTTLRRLEKDSRPATAAEQAVLARWSGWGAVPAVFDGKAAAFERFAWARDELRAMLSAEEYAAAERNTLNAHYTDAAYVEAVWAAVQQLGFTGGAVLEPGCGSGNFLGLAPEGAQLAGVELDPVTAGVAAALYPHAQVYPESFAGSRFPEASFDLVVGNVPFGDITLHDRRHNQGEHRIHNHFIIKGLHLTRPGGLVAVVTSRYTMDAANPSARREMADVADLVGAVRLPTGAHRRAAGTDVVTDILILRRREDGVPAGGHAFERSQVLDLGGSPDEPLRMNEYFIAHPEYVLGTLHLDQGDRGRAELGVAGDRAAGPALRAALSSLTDRAREAGLVMEPPSPSAEGTRPAARLGAASQQADGYLAAKPDGTFTRVEGRVEVPYRPASTQAQELRALLGLRDVVVALLEAEAASVDDSAGLDALRAQLNRRYDAYGAAYGAINRFTWRSTGRRDPVSCDEKMARVSPPQGGFRADPFANVVLALEHFDPSTQRATKATIFRERVVARRAPRLGADSPADALALCLDSFGEVRLAEIARLLGATPEEARAQLGTLVFDEPGTGRVVPAAEYLSGNVRTKLAAAQAAAAEDARFVPNVAALTAVLPRDLAPDEIDARMGAAWIDAEYVRQFLGELLEDGSIRVEHPGGALWAVKSSYPNSVLAVNRWGTQRCSAIDIATALLEQRSIRIYDTNRDDGTRTFNPTETVAALEKATEMTERFREWVWEDPGRAAALARIYNDQFNAIVLRSYDGAKLSLPGLAVTFAPRDHQVAAVARIINEPAVGLFHEVGAGKTAEMVMGAMELRRLGLVAKPAVVVPNHMLEQFTREWLQLYPQAKLLAAAKEDLERDRRRLFVAKVATGDWDGIVMTRSAFERIPMSREAQRDYLEREVAAIVRMIEKAHENDNRFSMKRLQKMKVQAEERLKAKLDGAKDPGITFEQLGVDYVFADEAHGYKNLRTTSNINGMSVDGSQRATDLHMKLEYLRERHKRVATLATATPIANTMGEAYTMQRYLRPDLLAAAGVSDFDVWAATFGETTTAIEVAPDGCGMRMQTRFAKFRNVPELLLLWRVSADIKTAEDLKLPVPALAVRPSDGQRAPETVVVAPSEPLKDYVQSLAKRAERVRGRGVDPSEDNLLKISSDGRAAALDLRLVGGSTEEPQKVDVAAERIAGIFQKHSHNRYSATDGSLHPTPGALQLVFADLGTPTSGRWSVYEQLRAVLVERGVPRHLIRFVHEAKNDKEKGELFSACREGRVAVLIGSTERMGVGTNVQRRVRAIHHMDCPWRPADLTQREGRGLRQGNENEDIEIHRYVTEGSFDAYLWQTVTRKAQFIAQVMRGRLDVREIDDIGDTALSYNEVKALATGNPLLLEQAQAQAEVNRLDRLHRAHARNQETLRWTVRDTEQRLERMQQRIVETESAIARRPDMSAEAFRMTVGDRVLTKAPEAAELLRRALVREAARGRSEPVQVATHRGIPVTAGAHFSGGVTVELAGVPGSGVSLSQEELAKAALITRLDNRLTALEALRESCAFDVQRLHGELARGRSEIGKPFRHAEQLEAGKARLRVIEEQITAVAMPTPQPAAPAGAQEVSADPTQNWAEEREARRARERAGRGFER